MSDPLEQQRLGDPFWRLNNLYKIKNKKGKVVTLKLNWAQLELYHNMHYLNCILKARQLGMTTLIQIFMLDRCLFNDNQNAGVVAHNKEDAEAFFADKIKFAYDNLPEDLRRLRHADTNTTRALKFSNGSMIRVGTSMRSGTYQYIHISEFGKMCAKYPDKAQEVITGTLNTVAPGQMVFIESTAEGPFGEFYDMCREAQDLTQAVKNGQTRFSMMDYKFFFLDWWRHPDYVLHEEVEIPDKLAVYFQELRTEHGIDLRPEQKAWYVKKKAEQGDKMKQEFPSVWTEAFERSSEVAIYGASLRKTREEKRICKLPLMKGRPVHTFWDLGRNDSTAIWFMQEDGPWFNFIYYMEGRLKELADYAADLVQIKQDLGIFYGTHHLPHDVEVTDLSTVGNRSRRRILEEAGVAPITVVARCKILNDAIELTRRMFSKCRFDEEGCEQGLRALAAYEWGWDDLNKIARKTPAPGWANHGADAFRQCAQGYRGSGTGFLDQQARFGMDGGGGRKYARGESRRGTLTNPTTDHLV